MLQGGIKIFTVRGIEIRLDYSWFLIFVLVTWSLAAQYFPQQHPHWTQPLYWSLGLVTSLLFFLSVLLHELAHSFVAQSRGIPVPRITLFIFGGAAQIAREPKKAGDELVMALAGPGMSVLIGAVSGLLWWVFKGMGLEPFSALFGWLALINVSLAVFNLIPGFPLDGGRVLRAIIWGVSKDSSRSTMIAGAVGKGVAFMFIFMGVFMLFRGSIFNGVWIAFIGWFLLQAASASTRQQALTDLLAGHTAGEVMLTDCPFLDSDTLVSDLVYRHILHTGRRCFPVLDHGKVSGIVTVHNVKAVPVEQWSQTTARSIMIPAEQLKSVLPETPLTRVMELISADGVNQAPVVKDGRFIGMVSRDAVMDFLRNKSELGLK
ncbi:MAG TPA: site-2 protease family protein [bacterium]|nr:site-2 protease family protein [bacterium]